MNTDSFPPKIDINHFFLYPQSVREPEHILDDLQFATISYREKNNSTNTDTENQSSVSNGPYPFHQLQCSLSTKTIVVNLYSSNDDFFSSTDPLRLRNSNENYSNNSNNKNFVGEFTINELLIFASKCSILFQYFRSYSYSSNP